MSDPIERFREWFAEASAAGGQDPKAAVLATADDAGRPSSRVVLIQYFDERGFVFFTNLASRKAREIALRPDVTLCVFWPMLDRQVRVEGRATAVPPAEADAYFATRPRESQIGAWASRQSAVLPSRHALDAAVQQRVDEFADREIPRPPFWSGFRIAPDVIEFWTSRAGRLHHREQFVRDGLTWSSRLLFP